MRHDREPDPLWLRCYKKAIWNRKTPVLVLVGLFFYSLAANIVAKAWPVSVYLLCVLNFVWSVLLAVASMAIIVRPAMYGRKWKPALLKLTAVWLLAIAIFTFHSLVTSRTIEHVLRHAETCKS